MFTDGERNVVNINGNKSTFLVKAGEPVTIPCIATHPNVTVFLIIKKTWRNQSQDTEVTKNNLCYYCNNHQNTVPFKIIRNFKNNLQSSIRNRATAANL